MIAYNVAGDLGAPVDRVVLRRTRAALAIMAMPEAPVYEDGLAHGAKDKIGFARQLRAVEPVASGVAERAHQRTDIALGRRVARLYSAHNGRTFFGAEDVRARCS